MPISTDQPLEGDERLAWLALARVPGIGPRRMRALLAAHGSVTEVLAAPPGHLPAGLPPEVGRRVLEASRDAAEAEVRAGEAEGGRLLLPGDAAFPDLVLPLDDAPLCLWARGRLELLDRPAVAIVGSRDHTRYGHEVCDDLAFRAAEAGLVVVSGLARGLDAVAHGAALRAGGDTIGVLGTGLGLAYPVSNRRLGDEVAARGLLLTEAPPGARPTEGSFPRRNRIIAALARVTVVVEAAASSGALITANVANDLSRHVMAVPGPITSPQSVGTNRLIQHGAHPILTLADLLARYPEVATPAAGPTAADAGDRGVLAVLRRGAAHADEIGERLGLARGEVLATLGALEIAGQVRQEPGLRFALASARLAAEAMPTPGPA